MDNYLDPQICVWISPINDILEVKHPLHQSRPWFDSSNLWNLIVTMVDHCYLVEQYPSTLYISIISYTSYTAISAYRNGGEEYRM
jgi:hypothetical protein